MDFQRENSQDRRALCVKNTLQMQVAKLKAQFR